MKASELLILNEVYSRDTLAENLRIQDRRLNGTHGEGIVPLQNFDSVAIFITERKPKDRTQYEDRLIGDELFMDGQKSKKTDFVIFQHQAEGKELLLFHRHSKDHYKNLGHGYQYRGPFHFVTASHSGNSQPTRFQLRSDTSDRPSDLKWLDLNKVSVEPTAPFDASAVVDERRKVLRAITARQGQRTFRETLLQLYDGRCAVTNCDVVQALEAAHILPYLGTQSNHLSNGLLLRSDLHVLFDLGLIGVATEQMRIIISPKLKGSCYEALDGTPLRIPCETAFSPSKEALDIHKQVIFQCKFD